MSPLELHAFDAVRSGADTRLRASLDRAGGMLSLRYELEGPLARWVIPPQRPDPRRRERLWEATCFEAFLAPAAAARYWELNLSPAGDWNLYRFDGYRRGMRLEARAVAPTVQTTTDGERSLALTAVLDVGVLGEIAMAALDVALSAVLAETDGPRSYWALRHGAAQPDFHRRESFTVRLGEEGA